MNTVIICENALDPLTWETIEVDDLCKFLSKRFNKWPETAKIFHHQVAQNCDVTPYDDPSIEKLQSLTGTFYVVIYPEGIETILIIVAIGIAALAVGLSFLLRPHASTPNIPNQQESSPNNQLAARENKERVNGRIPDIEGRVWSTPDLIAVPYKIFVAGVEQEYAYYCIGRGSYTIGLIRDDLTPLAQVTGASVEVYGPFTSPNGGTVQLRLGAAIATPVLNVKASTSVNGQTLLAANLAGTGFIGPFLVGDATTTDIWFNFVAEAGAYQVDGTTGVQTAVTVSLQVGITPVDASGTATGAEVLTSANLVGSATRKDQIGVTLKVHLGTPGMSSVRAHRTSNTTISANISVSDETKWRDCYAVAPVSQTDFGDITTVQTLTLPTQQALALKARKLNILVTRNIPIGTLAGGVVTFSAPGPTDNAADIICAIAQDEKIGNRSAAEIDFVGIYTAINANIAYFGTDLCSKFDFTFDDAKVSFEESIADIAAAVGCVAYRRGSLLTLSFEKLTANSTILFNHRNKVPNSETRTVTFGFNGDIDGLDFTYNEPNDPLSPNQDTPKTLSFPLNVYHMHCTGGTSGIKFLYDAGVGLNGVAYVIQLKITITGVAPITVDDGYAHTQIVAPGTTVFINFNLIGDGATHVVLRFSGNVGDEFNFNGSNPFIAKVSDLINLIASDQQDFVGANWSAFSGATVVVTPVAPTSVNPKQITAVGIRNNVQAYIIASRLYNKILYQNTVVEFQSLEEAALLVLNDRILVADNTRSDTQDGEVIAQVGLLLTLSQPVTFIGGRTYTIFLQHYDETIESISITQPDATKPTQVLLAGAPSIPLVIDRNVSAALTTYMVVDNTPQRANAFLLSEKTPQSAKTYDVKAVNYDDRYYSNDGDFVKGFVGANGPEGTGSAAIAAGGTYRPTIVNDLNIDSLSSGLTVSAGTVHGFFTAAIPPSHVPPYSDGSPADIENGDVIWNGFAPVRFTTNVTLHVVVSAIVGTVISLSLNGVAVVLAGAATYTIVIPAGTYISTCAVEAQVNSPSGGSGHITITDIFIS